MDSLKAVGWESAASFDAVLGTPEATILFLDRNANSRTNESTICRSSVVHSVGKSAGIEKHF